MTEIKPCRLCGVIPITPEYNPNHTSCVVIDCGCGIEVKVILGRFGMGKTGWDVDKSCWNQASIQAVDQWNKLMSVPEQDWKNELFQVATYMDPHWGNRAPLSGKDIINEISDYQLMKEEELCTLRSKVKMLESENAQLKSAEESK